jgi:uncharacterized repeat protein (TIGR03803 family)
MASASSLPRSSKPWSYLHDTLRIALTTLILLTIAHGQATEKVIRTLGSPYARGGLIFDTKGNLYGTNSGSGRNYGAVFESVHFANGSWGHHLLYSFTGGSDGAYPNSSPVLDAAGNLYGAAAAGGTNFCDFIEQALSCGVVFELMPTAKGFWTEKVLYNFEGGTDGANPSAGVIFDSAGNLYGTTQFGGNFHGTVFELVHGPDDTWTEKVLYTFTNGLDGGGPSGGLVQDRLGNLFGTTVAGGANASGTIFELSPGTDGNWLFNTLYSFCSRANCSDGHPGNSRVGSLILDKARNLYGSNGIGGIRPCGWDMQFGSSNGCGTLFRLTRGLNNTWSFNVLHSFCPVRSSCPEGRLPERPDF